MSAPAIQVEGVTAGYRGVPVLRGLSFEVPEGGLVGILGPNGAGKSTLFRVLTGLHPTEAGRVRLFGRGVANLSARERAQQVAVVPQELDVPVAFTVEEMVMLGRTASLSRWSGASERDRQAVERALAYTDVTDVRHRPFPALSGGEKQRAVVAMALAQEPRLILMDEATSHLDINHRLEIMQLVERLNQTEGVTVVLISHDLSLAAEFCRRLLLLDQGQLVADGSPAQVLTPQNLRRVYRCDIRVQPDPETGSLSILPAPRLTRSDVGAGRRIHVVAGGGCGEEVLRRLALSGYGVSCGVLNRGDLDTEVAAALGAELALEQPFSPVGAAALGQARALSAQAEAVVLTAVPFGTGNLANLALLEDALARGCPVAVCAGIEQRDYTPNREAVARVQALVAKGALVWRDAAELVALLAGSGKRSATPGPARCRP
jgi:iron complex transport system ATP-binding protein